ncbi:MAG: phosphoribosyltransferase [Acidimicrobiia bacterium]|nr:phosphoribosyltransferase [Acidimicrobiia bacterium]
MAVDPTARARDLFEEAGAIRTGGHFVYTSGRHGSAYVNKDAVYPDTRRISELCGLLAGAVAGFRPEIVCGPAVAGIIVAQWTAHHLGVPAVYADKVDSGLVLARGYDRLVSGRRVAVVEDVVTTGGSLARTVAAVEAAGGTTVVAAALVNRGGVSADDVSAPSLVSLLALDFESVAAAECELCAAGVPIDTGLGKAKRGS